MEHAGSRPGFSFEAPAVAGKLLSWSPARFLLCAWLCFQFMLPAPLDAIDAPRSVIEAAGEAAATSTVPHTKLGRQGAGQDHANTPCSMYHHGGCRQRGSAPRWSIPEPRMGHEAKLLCVIGQRRSRLLVWWSRDAASGPCASRPSDSCLGCLAGCLGWGIAAFRFWDCLGAGDAS